MAEYDGLRFIFDFYNLKMTTEEQADTNTVWVLVFGCFGDE